MPEQKIDVTIHDDNWRGNGCGFLLIFWIVIMFLLNLLKALMTLASCFFYCLSGDIGLISSGWNCQGSMELDAAAASLEG